MILPDGTSKTVGPAEPPEVPKDEERPMLAEFICTKDENLLIAGD